MQPTYVVLLVQLNLGQTIQQTIEMSMVYIDLVEQCIQCAEKISQVNPRHILKNGILLHVVNLIDFFD